MLTCHPPGSRDSAGFSEVEWWFYRAHVEYQSRTSDLPQNTHGWNAVIVYMTLYHRVLEHLVGEIQLDMMLAE